MRTTCVPPINADPLSAALHYAENGWPVFPVNPATKRPLTRNGFKDATRDLEQARAWWSARPDALIGVPTGAETGIVVLDVDVREDGNGFDTLEELGISTHPETPTAHSASGGVHLYFRHPGGYVPCSAEKIGRRLDVRGDGGYIIVPPGPGRYWDPALGLDRPFAEMPKWMVPPERQARATDAPRPALKVAMSRYAEVALDNAVRRIVSAPAGAQERTLNSEVYGIGRLVGGNVIPAGLALESLLWAAKRMPSHDPRRPWHPVELDKKVRRAFTAGMLSPRSVS